MICVASGKGGVGKSTMTANLAAALQAEGHKAGALDADVYGYSIPRMLGVNQQARRQRRAQDHAAGLPAGVKVMSIGFFVEENAAVVWRGPMLHKAIQQFLEDVDWGELDYLLLDLPPGTGDVSMTLAQLLPQARILIVTTPQPAAQTVARRAAEMAAKVDLEVLGVIENMSGFTDPDGERFTIFGEGGGQLLADELDVPLLGKVPLRRSCASTPTRATPLVLEDPQAPASRGDPRGGARDRRRDPGGAAGDAGPAAPMPEPARAARTAGSGTGCRSSRSAASRSGGRVRPDGRAAGRLLAGEVLGVDLRELRPLLGELVLGEAGVDGAGLDAGVAVDALVGIDEELLLGLVVGLVGRRVDAIDRADLDARVVLLADAGLCDHVGQVWNSLPGRLSMRSAVWLQRPSGADIVRRRRGDRAAAEGTSQLSRVRRVILLTGATGVVGSALLPQLLDAGHEVRAWCASRAGWGQPGRRAARARRPRRIRSRCATRCAASTP